MSTTGRTSSRPPSRAECLTAKTPQKREAVRLPSVAITNMQGKSADLVWTRAEWVNLCAHLHNGNERLHFVMGFQKDGAKKYVRSKTRPVEGIISWSWASITKPKLKRKQSFVPYSANGTRSRWGGMDFDAHHDGQLDRARELAFAAFRILLNETAGMAVILESSGTGGWHVWVIAPDFRDRREWVLMMKRVASTIGTVIADGVCEIFPHDSDPAKFSKGMRAPGCWNPSNGSLSEIFWENTRTTIPEVLSGKSAAGEVLSGKWENEGLISSGLESDFPDKERNVSFSSLPLPFLSLLQGQLAITSPRTRNTKLTQLAGEVFHQLGREQARRLAGMQHDQATVTPQATREEHLAAFDNCWSGLEKHWRSGLSAAERDAFARLVTEHERDAFKIVRSFSLKAITDGKADFPIVRDNLAERLAVTGKGAGCIRDKLARLGITRRTADHVPNKSAARYAWLLGREAKP